MTFKHATTLALLLVLSSPALADARAAKAKAKAKELLDSGYEWLADGDPQRAAKLFHKARELTFSRELEPLLALAETYLFEGSYEQASEWTSQANELALEPMGRALVERMVARTHLKVARDNRLKQETQGNRVKLRVQAELLLKQAVPHLKDSLPEVWLDLARAIADQGRHAQALEALDNYFDREPAAASNIEATQLRCFLETATTYVSPPRSDDSVMTKPKKIYDTNPQLTPAARTAGVHGVVILQGYILKEGHGCYQVLSGLPFGLSEYTLGSVATWRFEPATLDGAPVIVQYNLTVSLRPH